MSKFIDFIKDLSNANGAPGFEDEVVEVIKNYIKDALIVEEDKMRNLIIKMPHYDSELPTVMLDGHSDEVAFMVQSIMQNGMIKFIPLGGWMPQNVGAHLVRVRNKHGQYIPGVVGSKPPHFMTESERGKITEISDMVIDLGTTSYEDTTTLFDIEVGAPIVPEVNFEYHAHSDMMLGKAFDNRLGCALVVETMLALKDKKLEVNLVGAISAQEEVGTRGAVITARKIKPDVAIVFEGTPADDPYRGSYERQGALKAGTQIRHRDSSMVSNPRFIQLAKSIGQEKQHKMQHAIRSGGGTDAGKIHLSHEAVPTLVMGVPVRYAHTHYGFSAYEDYQTTLNFAIDLMLNINKEIINSL
ncbi:MAG: M20/M25/M40 family metallo-hydrolase [Clostridia bacterium]|nr:M20/M25/M40 family metallo-hydrolase [Clostridia bacterium]